MKTSIKFIVLLLSTSAFSQNYIPYYPADWEFKNDVDLIDFSQVKSVESEEFIIDNNEQFLYTTTSWNWNSTYQLTYYSITNHQFKDGSLDIQINYANPNGNQVKSVKILNPNTRKTTEEWQYTNGSFDVEKIKVKRYLLNVAEPDTFEVKYKGNDDDFIEETVYTPQNKIERQTKRQHYQNQDGGHMLSKKTYSENFLNQTDSLVMNSNGKMIKHYLIEFDIPSETKYIYKTRKVEVYGEQYDYQELVNVQKQGKDDTRYEYQYDTKGNWIVRKTYKMKKGKWEYDLLTKRNIEYR